MSGWQYAGDEPSSSSAISVRHLVSYMASSARRKTDTNAGSGHEGPVRLRLSRSAPPPPRSPLLRCKSSLTTSKWATLASTLPVPSPQLSARSFLGERRTVVLPTTSVAIFAFQACGHPVLCNVLLLLTARSLRSPDGQSCDPGVPRCTQRNDGSRLRISHRRIALSDTGRTSAQDLVCALC